MSDRRGRIPTAKYVYEMNILEYREPVFHCSVTSCHRTGDISFLKIPALREAFISWDLRVSHRFIQGMDPVAVCTIRM